MLGDNIVSRKSHYWHEGKKSDYAQASELWSRVMDDRARAHTASNTAKLLSTVAYPEIQVRSNCLSHPKYLLTN
jgi:catalase